MAQPHHSLISGLTAGALLHGRYRVVRLLHSGATSGRYLVQDVEHQNQHRVLRLLDLHPDTRDRLRREIPALLGLAHEHLAPLVDSFEIGEVSALVTEQVEGPDLTARLAEEGPLPADEVAAIGRGVALALQAAHRRGVLHRGVSPRTIILAAETRARLTDFGAADIDGERDYRAPEVHAGHGADIRADLYGLGLTLYTLLTGTLPAAPRADLPPPASPDGFRASLTRGTVPPWLDDAIAQATAALPADRYRSAGKLAEALTPGPLLRRPGGVAAPR